MNRKRDPYYTYKIGLSKLLESHNLNMMSKDNVVINRIFKLLTEDAHTDKIEGIISTTEIVKYGGDIEEEKSRMIYMDILRWWGNNGI